MELGRGEGRAKDMTWLVSGRAVWKDLRSPAIAAFFFPADFWLIKLWPRHFVQSSLLEMVVLRFSRVFCVCDANNYKNF